MGIRKELSDMTRIIQNCENRKTTNEILEAMFYMEVTAEDLRVSKAGWLAARLRKDSDVDTAFLARNLCRKWKRQLKKFISKLDNNIE